ncbi:hypothetical protein A3Q56_08678 [Intoshia linei]|uniref:Uncharacterized protein n=1 Tax=Intoshia linei TaxID=1819745 RepID=A0A177ANJ3_9BILA|nr:hypothetical protein A3Q56_08678 [Intoshia linei]
MIEKLGRKVSLTRLDSVTVNSTIEKLKQEIVDKDKVNDARIDKIKVTNTYIILKILLKTFLPVIIVA